MENIQNHLMQDGDPDETPSVEETPTIFESIPPQVGPLGEIVEPTILSGTSLQADLEERLRIMKEIQLKEIPEGAEFSNYLDRASYIVGPSSTPYKTDLSRKDCNSGNAIGDSSWKPR